MIGETAMHLVVSDACRRGRTDNGAITEAFGRIRQEYGVLCNNWPIGKDAKIHLYVTLERPYAGMETDKPLD